MLRAVLLVGVVVIATPSPADACIPLANQPHDLDPAYASDTIAPAAVRISDAWAWSRKAAGTCGANADLYVIVRASDDTTPEDKLGFQVRVVGSTGSDVWAPANPVLAIDHDLILGFDPDADAFSVDLEVAAVDLNGNVGPFTPFHFDWVKPADPEEESGGGCATSSGAGWVAALALLALRRRRR